MSNNLRLVARDSAIVHRSILRTALMKALTSAVCAVAMHVDRITQWKYQHPGWPIEGSLDLAHEMELAVIRDRLAWDLVSQIPDAPAAAAAPISWAIQELIEFVAHWYRATRLGDYTNTSGLSWMPQESCGFDLLHAVDERLDLLVAELHDFSVTVEST